MALILSGTPTSYKPTYQPIRPLSYYSYKPAAGTWGTSYRAPAPQAAPEQDQRREQQTTRFPTGTRMPTYPQRKGSAVQTQTKPAYGTAEWARLQYGNDPYRSPGAQNPNISNLPRYGGGGTPLPPTKPSYSPPIDKRRLDANPNPGMSEFFGMPFGTPDPNWVEDYNNYIPQDGGGGEQEQYYEEYPSYPGGGGGYYGGGGGYAYPSWGGGSYGSSKPGFRGMNDVYWRI